MRTETKSFFELYKQKAYGTGYHNKICEEIKKKVNKLTLPKIKDEKIKKYRNALELSNKKYEMSKKEIQDKFLDVIDMIYFLYSTTGDEDLQPYIKYLVEYEYIVKKILESKKNKLSQGQIANSLIILRPEIEQFIAKFSRIAEGDVDTKQRTDTDEILGGDHE